MNLIPFLLGATIIFWGWQTGFWLVAIPLAIICETARYINWRWDLTTADFRQTSHVCTVLLVGVLIYLLVSDRSLGLIFDFFQWLPVICAPLLIAQTYSTSDRVDLNALLFFKDKPQQKKRFLLDLTYPYFAICILAASAANTRDLLFYGAAIVLIARVLMANANVVKPKRYSTKTFIALFFLAAILGAGGHIGLHQFQLSLERNTAKFFYGFYRPHSDPNQVSTAIGDIGSVKQSNKIVLRVKPSPQQIPPQLLRRAVYNKYSSGFWLAAKPNFTPLKSQKDETTWTITNPSSKSRQITVSENMDENDTLLKLPNGSRSIAGVTAEKIEQNQYGTIQIYSDASFLSYQIDYDPDLSTDSPPTPEDLKVLDSEKPAIKEIVTQLDLNHKTPLDILTAVSNFFNTEFDYSLELARQGNNKTPLSAFLLQHRSGHCEYFATATALLLREVGIPTRYVVGYSVNELSSLEKQYVVRSRNAHAWTQVYINDKWQTFDTTPASWIAWENRNTSSWQTVKDVFSWITFTLLQTIALFKTIGKTNYLWLLAIPLIVILIREFTNKGQKRRLIVQEINQKNRHELAVGIDSELFLIESELNKLGLKRDRAETWQDWLIRLQNTPETFDTIEDLSSIIELHYRYRFDPLGIDSQTRAKLRSDCQEWLAKHRSSTIDNH
ncbi:transglutaminase domain-containing protein [Waterburya agarophytonicola K14]|uniref:Transglutaminase domain-containing protein n=1 Tax=Waterburya agarophytonicola KI4 TaxID=2874699 RepID=A0A964BLS3_9CYAN|nr:transglutaminase-like domain-containing protein [Waterburya agarophytonicola]MCC0175725.1 transglutaminase domain-containing protein [Waterburya agarophytonicola KI4]